MSQSEAGQVGYREATAIGGMVGGGIFAMLGLSVDLAHGGAPVAFLVAGIIALVTAYSYARLSVAFPGQNGTVAFLDRAFGPGLVTGSANILLSARLIGKAEDRVVLIKLAILVLFVAAGLQGVDGSRLAVSTWASPLQLVAGGMIILLAYEGFELIANTARNVRAPATTLPRACYSARPASPSSPSPRCWRRHPRSMPRSMVRRG